MLPQRIEKSIYPLTIVPALLKALIFDIAVVHFLFYIQFALQNDQLMIVDFFVNYKFMYRT